jgi:hypothetical protein
VARSNVTVMDLDWNAELAGQLESHWQDQPYAGLSMAALVLHIHREVIHHGAEICLLRDLYLRRG